MAKIDPKMRPSSPQDRPKTVLRRIKNDIVFKAEFIIGFCSSWVPSWCPFGSSWGLRVSSWGRLGGLLGPQGGPKIDASGALKISTPQENLQDHPRALQETLKTPKPQTLKHLNPQTLSPQPTESRKIRNRTYRIEENSKSTKMIPNPKKIF